MSEPKPAAAPGGPSRRRALLGGTGLLAASQLILLFINLVLTPFVIEGLGPARFSIYLLVSSVTVLMSAFDGGIGPTAQRFFSIYAGSGDVRARSRLLGTLIGVTLTSTLVIFPLLVAAAPWLAGVFGVEDRYLPETVFLMRSLIVLTGALLVRNLFNSLLFAHGRFTIVAAAQISSHAVFATGMILTVRQDWGLYGVAGTLIAVQVLVTLVNVPAALRLVELRQTGWMGREPFWEFAGYAWKVQLSTMLTLATAQKDQLVAGRLLSAQNSGPFGQGSNLAAQLSRLPLNALSPMQSMMGMDVGKLGPHASREPTQKLQRVWVRFAGAWLAVGAPALYVGVRAWLPPSFELTGVIVPILMAGLFFQLCGTVLVLWCLTLGRPDLQLEMMGVGLAVNLVLSVLLYLGVGMIGVVIATGLSNVVAALYLQRRAAAALEHPLRSFLRDIPVWQMLVIAGVTAALELLAEPWLPDGFLGIALAGVVALPGLVLAGVLLVPAAERRAVLARVRRRRAG